MITKIFKTFCGCLVGCGIAAATVSCDDFFKQESDDVLYADQEHLNNAVDTVYSVVGILNKLQVLADRTILLGEVRGDLVEVTNDAASDLRELANFNISDDNAYNSPSDYYAVINNCNYYIAHADTALKSRNEYIFMREYAAVKAIRAWTYLQLVLNYGRVPFVTEPMLSREEAEQAETASVADLPAVCSYFIDDLSTLRQDLNNAFPVKGISITGVTDTKQLFFPLSLIRAELYLWRASATGSQSDYREAALQYFQFINERNGQNSTYPTGLDNDSWSPGTTTWRGVATMLFPTRNTDLITLIACGNTPAAGNYSELRNLFNSREDNDWKVSIVPSQGMFDLSESQVNCVPSNDGTSVVYAPAGLEFHRSGDLRLTDAWMEDYRYDRINEYRVKTSDIVKYSNSQQHVNIYRSMTVYLHLAEALNGAGYPRMAFLILQKGISNSVIQNEVLPYYYTESDSIYLSRFDFNDTRYAVMDINDVLGFSANHNMMGIHSRGSGWTPMNEFYVLPNDTIEPDAAKRQQLVAEQQVFVDSLLLNENGLEFAFEGTRFYDIMRFAMRQPNPGAFLANKVYGRKGKDNVGTTRSEIQADLTNQRNWYLHWKGKIGY